MRPKKVVAKAAPPPLAGCSIAISGTIPGRTQAAVDKDFIRVLGASLAKSVTASTTHLITNEADYERPSAKVKAAQSHNAAIVSFQWLEDSLSQMKRMAEDDYSFDSSQSQPSQTDNVRKRRAPPKPTDDDNDDDDDDDVIPAPTKRSKPSETKAQEQKGKEAKVADGQIAKTRDVRIPVDTGASSKFPKHEVYIGDDGVIYDASLNQTNAANNNNKFYRIQV